MSNLYYVYKVANSATGDVFLIYSEDKEALRNNIKEIVSELTTTEDGLVGAYSDRGIEIASSDETFGFDTYETNEDGEITIKGVPTKIIGVQTFRF